MEIEKLNRRHPEENASFVFNSSEMKRVKLKKKFKIITSNSLGANEATVTSFSHCMVCITGEELSLAD